MFVIILLSRKLNANQVHGCQRQKHIPISLNILFLEKVQEELTEDN